MTNRIHERVGEQVGSTGGVKEIGGGWQRAGARGLEDKQSQWEG